jgi:hypothetical protein
MRTRQSFPVRDRLIPSKSTATGAAASMSAPSAFAHSSGVSRSVASGGTNGGGVGGVGGGGGGEGAKSG